MFGWLQIDEIIKGEKDIKNYLKLKKFDHPHGFEDVSRYKNNTLYLGANELTLNRRKTSKRGYGLFKKTHRDLILTEENKTRSNWQFPNDFKNSKNLFMNRLKWSDPKKVKLSYRGYGQEFVLNVEANPKIASWACKLIHKHG